MNVHNNSLPPSAHEEKNVLLSEVWALVILIKVKKSKLMSFNRLCNSVYNSQISFHSHIENSVKIFIYRTCVNDIWNTFNELNCKVRKFEYFYRVAVETLFPMTGQWPDNKRILFSISKAILKQTLPTKGKCGMHIKKDKTVWKCRIHDKKKD